MNEYAVARLESSFNLLVPRGQELVDRFYAHLFSANPPVRALFPTAIKEQEQKLLASLTLVVRNIRNPQKLREPLVEMGRRRLNSVARIREVGTRRPGVGRRP